MTEQCIRINAEGTNLSAIFYFQKSASQYRKGEPDRIADRTKTKKAEKGGKKAVKIPPYVTLEI